MTFSQLAGVNLEELQRLDFIKVVSVSGELGKSTERYLVLLITGLAEGAELKISLGKQRRQKTYHATSISSWRAGASGWSRRLATSRLRCRPDLG